ncbi:MAG: hypothetical protein J7K00_05685 [Candidatus Diapherotrites archaeon]|nr:hypothetical protein [Candidatus Diapherotrites archaeon]
MTDKQEDNTDLLTDIKGERDKLNEKVKSLASNRKEIREKFNKILDIAREAKIERDLENTHVSSFKAEREEIRKKLDASQAILNELEKTHRELAGDSPVSYANLKKRMNAIDWKIQTELVGREKERSLVEEVTRIQKQLDELKDVKDVEEKLFKAKNEFSTNLKEFKVKKAAVMKHAARSEKCHQKMLEAFKKADELRKQLDESDPQFEELKQTANEKHEEFVGKLKKIEEKDKAVKQETQKKISEKRAKVTKEKQERAEDIFEALKSGQKIDLEDILILQKFGLDNPKADKKKVVESKK